MASAPAPCKKRKERGTPNCVVGNSKEDWFVESQVSETAKPGPPRPSPRRSLPLDRAFTLIEGQPRWSVVGSWGCDLEGARLRLVERFASEQPQSASGREECHPGR